MNATNIRGMLLAMLIGAAMVAGVLLAAPSRATTEQDYTYISLLENNGVEVTAPQDAIFTARIICNELDAGRNWRLVMTELMTAADFDLDTASTIMAAAIIAYCPQNDPTVEEQNLT